MNKELEKTLKYAHEVKKDNYKIRIYVKNGVPLFSIADIAKASGIKTPTNWVRRSIATEPRIRCTRILWPKETTSGIRRFNIMFVTADEAKRVMRFLPIFGETRRWILEDVLTFGKPGLTIPQEPKFTQAFADTRAAHPHPELDSIYADRIDSLIFELLEIKRQIKLDKKCV